MKFSQPSTQWEINNIDELIEYWKHMRRHHVDSIVAVDATIQSLSEEREKLESRLRKAGKGGGEHG